MLRITMKHLLPLVYWTILFLTKRPVEAQVPPDLNTRGVPYPEVRFRQYEYLDNATIEAISRLGYSESTWNRPGEEMIEMIPFDDLGLMAPNTVLSLGFTRESWDCYMTHYTGDNYLWSDLATRGVQDYLIALGWTEQEWGRNFPDIYDDLWDELSPEARANATELCYFQYTWDRESLTIWTTGPPTDSPTDAPTTMPSAAPTDIASMTPSMSPSADSSDGSSIVVTSFLVVIAGAMTWALFV